MLCRHGPYCASMCSSRLGGITGGVSLSGAGGMSSSDESGESIGVRLSASADGGHVD